MVFADKYLNYRYKLGLAKGLEQGALGERARWTQYLRDVEAARKAGKPEPAPPPAEVNGSVNR